MANLDTNGLRLEYESFGPEVSPAILPILGPGRADDALEH